MIFRWVFYVLVWFMILDYLLMIMSLVLVYGCRIVVLCWNKCWEMFSYVMGLCYCFGLAFSGCLYVCVYFDFELKGFWVLWCVVFNVLIYVCFWLRFFIGLGVWCELIFGDLLFVDFPGWFEGVCVLSVCLWFRCVLLTWFYIILFVLFVLKFEFAGIVF